MQSLSTPSCDDIQDKIVNIDRSQLPDTPISCASEVIDKKSKIENPTDNYYTTQLPDTPTSLGTTELESFDSSTSSSWSRGPGSDRHDILLDEAERFRHKQSMKRAQLDREYGAFRDDDPCFPDDRRHLSIPKSVSGIDRVIVTGQLSDMLKLENKALFYARLYRDRCADLQQRCRQLENEKEKVRYFWRNKVLEGQTRSGKILLMATK